MLAGAHLIFGNALALNFTQKPIAAFLIGLLSHHLGDFLPHLDTNIFNNASNNYRDKFKELKNWTLTLWLLFIIELALGLSIAYFFLPKFEHQWPIIILASLGALLPDIIQLTPLKKTFANFKIGKLYLNFHKRFHYIPKNQQLSQKILAGIFEGVIIALSLFLLIKPTWH
jgi:hypothetical protein